MIEPEEMHQPERRRRLSSGAVLGGLLAVAGLVWLLAAVDAVPVSAQVAIGGLLVLVGLALALLPEGAHHGLLVAAGITLALLGTAASALNLDLVEGSAGERRYAPVALTQVQHQYSLGIGSLGIDLTQLEDEPENDEGAISIRATIGIGELVVALPHQASLIVDAHIAMGEVRVRDQTRSGFDVRLQTQDEGRDGDGRAFRLQLEGGIGSVRVVDDELGVP